MISPSLSFFAHIKHFHTISQNPSHSYPFVYFREIVRPPGGEKIARTEVLANINPTYSKYPKGTNPYYSRLLLLYHRNALHVPFDRKVIQIREIGVSREGLPPLWQGGYVNPFDKLLLNIFTRVNRGAINSNFKMQIGASSVSSFPNTGNQLSFFYNLTLTY